MKSFPEVLAALWKVSSDFVGTTIFPSLEKGQEFQLKMPSYHKLNEHPQIGSQKCRPMLHGC